MSNQDTPPSEPPGTAFAEATREALRIDPEKLRRDTATVLARFWTKLRDALPRIPFVEDAVAAFHAATDPATPFRAKAILMGALAYFIAPVDVLPDFIALLGFTDDATVLLLAIRTVRAHLTEAHYERARAWLVAHRTGPVAAEEVAGGPVLDHDPGAGPGRPGGPHPA